MRCQEHNEEKLFLLCLCNDRHLLMLCTAHKEWQDHSERWYWKYMGGKCCILL